MRLGRLGDPREVEGLADDLKVRPVEALAYVLLWEEFILQVGDAVTGRVKGYRAKDIARKLTHTGPVEKLIRAMETAGILKRQRSTFYHPYWRETITGQYALTRAERREADRERKRRQRERDAQALAEARAAAFGETDVTRDTTVTAAGLPRDSTVSPEIKEERKKGTPGSGRPPGPPPGGGSLGFARWERVQELHNRPMNPSGCILMLEAMTDEQWALCLWVLENRDRERLSSLSRKKRAFGLDSYEFLRKSAFLQFRPEWSRKLAAPKEPDPKALAVNLEREREESRRRAIRELLEDPECPDTEKERQREIYLRAHPGEAAWLASIAAGAPSPSPTTNGVSN